MTLGLEQRQSAKFVASAFHCSYHADLRTASLYAGAERAAAAQAQTAYKWSFASKTSKADREAVASARQDVESVTYGARASASASSSSRPARTIGPIGPTLPTREDLTLAREATADAAAADRAYKRKRGRAEALERVEDAVGPRAVGREAQIENKRAKREDDRAFRERGDDGGLEADEGTLMGGGDSFRDQCVFLVVVRADLGEMLMGCGRIAKRDAAKRRFEEKKAAGRMNNAAGGQGGVSVIKERDQATMDMFKKMAAERFG